ncbi:hypothetical protein B296_00041351, partial [Ensete ventricosum]
VHLMCLAITVLGMSSNFINLCSDEESEEADVKDVKPILPLCVRPDKEGNSAANDQAYYKDCTIKQELEESRSPNSGSSITDQGSSSTNGIVPNFASPSPPVRLGWQFWKSGDYEVGQAISPISESIILPIILICANHGLTCRVLDPWLSPVGSVWVWYMPAYRQTGTSE